MKYRYLIVSNIYGNCSGTNAIQTALDFSISDDCTVIDAETGEVLTPFGARESVRSLDGDYA